MQACHCCLYSGKQSVPVVFPVPTVIVHTKKAVMVKRVLFLTAVLLFIANSTSYPVETHRHRPPVQTIKYIMDSMVDPSAEALWDSVASYATLKHVEQKAPHNEADWNELRRRASTLSIAARLLVVPDRPVAEPGDKSRNPRIELSPEQIETLINNDRSAWTALVHGLQTSAVLVLKAIDKKDLEGLRAANDGLNRTCEECHQKYWYPNRKKLLQQ
jgi:hypothetical protein